MTVSLLGDGIYLVAVAWQVYALSNAPAALALVGVSWSLGMLAFLLKGGAVADRMDRRRLMIASDAVRLAVLALIGALSLAGLLELWHLVALVLVFGAAEAFFGPAFSALVPDVVADHLLVEANAVEHAVRPFMLRLVGPALGGAVVGLLGPGGGFLVDAGTFAVSMAAVALMRPRPLVAAPDPDRKALREGLAFVRANAWLWATLVMAAISLLVFYGPEEVLLPYLIKNDLGGGAADFGFVLAAGGAGSILAAVWSGQRGIPDRNRVTFMYLWWGIGTLPIAGYALATATWQLMAMSLALGASMTMGMVVWTTLMQTNVPRELRGRVNSLDWFISIGLTPVSFALTAPAAALFGVDWTLIGAGVLGAVAPFLLLALVPGLGQSGDVLGEAGVRDGGGFHPDDLDALPAGEAGDGAQHGEPVVPVRVDRPAP
jgi:MFS family permease